MKKIVALLLALIVVFSIVGCAPKAEPPVFSLQMISNTFVHDGAELKIEKPDFAKMSATDGAQFTKNGADVFLYYYDNNKALDAAIKDNASLSAFTRNENILLNTTDAELIDLFKSIEKKAENPEEK